MRNYFSFLVPALIIFLGTLVFSQNTPRPNIVLIMADDMGYEVPGYTGGQSYSTPNIDQLAKTGTQFTHCYSTPKCSPSRVTIMTGRYLFRTTEEWGYIPPEEITFGHVLESAGYKVALAGKWQMALLRDDPLHIRKMGFEQSSVFGWHEGPRYHNPFIWQNGEKLENVSDLYGPDIFVNFLIDFISQNKEKPFFAYYPMALAHDVSNDFTPPPPPGPDGNYQSYKELIEYLDKNVGRLVSALDNLGLRENTLILFTTDNGTPQKSISDIRDGEYIMTPVISKWGKFNVPGGKGLLTDYGTHAPTIANWPGKTPAGKICSDLIDFSDFMPTLVDLAGASLPQDRKIDGQSFVPQILGQDGTPRKWSYNQFEGSAWIRTHRWKLYEDGKLFEMTSDPLEQNPILAENDGKESSKIRAYLSGELKNLKSEEY
jgi:arylsulfatase A